MNTTLFPSGLLLAAASLTALVTAGCAPSGNDSPEPTTSPTTSASPAQSVTIDNPKNLRAVGDTCSLLTPQQLKQLGMKSEPKHKDSMLGAPACDWRNDKFAMTITPDVNTGGIDQLYSSEPSAQKSTVSGYPAAWIDKQSSLCRVEVGVSKDTMVGISYTAFVGTEKAKSGTVKPCKEGEKIAAMVLKNIPDA